MSSSKPLILIDVDGPLNPYGAKPTRRPVGYTTHYFHIPVAVIARVPSAETRKLRVWLNVEHGPALLKLAEDNDAELAWATTWEHSANTDIAPIIGLPELPVIEWGFNCHHWKFDAVLEYTAGRSFIWFDDDFGRFSAEKQWFEEKRGADSRHRLHYVDPRIGLTELDFAQADRWLKENNV